MVRYRRYIEEEDNVIATMREQQYSTREIAEYLNRTFYSVRRRISVLRARRGIR